MFLVGKNPDDFRLTEEHGLTALRINEKVFHIFPPVDIFIFYLYNITWMWLWNTDIVLYSWYCDRLFTGVFQTGSKNDTKDPSCWFTHTGSLCCQAELIILKFIGCTFTPVTYLITYSEKLGVCWSVLQIMSPNVNLCQNTVNVSSQPNY